jgi:DNA methylase
MTPRSDALACRFPVRHKLFKTPFGERVVEQLADHIGGHGRHIRADLGAIEHMDGMAQRGRQYLGVKIIIVIDGADVFDQLQAVPAHIIMAADEGRDEARACLGGKQRLIGGEAQGDIDQHALTGERLAGFEAVHGERHLDADVAGDGNERCCLTHHALMVERHHFGTDRTIDQCAYLFHHRLEIPPGFFDQAGVGGDTIEQPGGGKLGNFLHIGSIDKKFHVRFPCSDQSRITTIETSLTFRSQIVLAMSMRSHAVNAQKAHPSAARALAYFDDLFPEAPKTSQPVEAVGHAQPASIFEQIKQFSAFGSQTQVIEQDGLCYHVNEYWTAGQRQAHSLHEISYRACFKPQLPRFFIERLTNAGDCVHDPFMGRGTTAIEAALLGRKALANDINPLSALLARPRLAPPTLSSVSAALAAIDWDQKAECPDELLVFYHPETLRKLMILQAWLQQQAPLDNPAPDPVADWIRMVAINRLTGHSPGFFSVYTMPPNQAVSIEAQKKINAKRQQVPPPRDLIRIILKKSQSLLADAVPSGLLPAHFMTGCADATPLIGDGSVDLVVTSPPFLDVVQYADDNWLRCWFAGIDTSNIAIAIHKSEAAWSAMVRRVLAEQVRILKPGGHVAFEVGEVRNGRLLLEKLVWLAAEGLPFERLGIMVNQQAFTKTANCWGVSNNKSGTNSNRIVLLRRQ